MIAERLLYIIAGLSTRLAHETRNPECNKGVDRQGAIASSSSLRAKRGNLAVFFSFPLDSARFMISNNRKIMQQLTAYNFDKRYMINACSYIELLSKEDESFPSVSLIARDEIEGKEVFVQLGGYCGELRNPRKVDYIYSCSKEERQYFDKVLNEGYEEYRFSSSYDFYELYYPATSGEKTIIMYFTDRKRYGKFGS